MYDIVVENKTADFNGMINIWENTDDYTEHHRCATGLYLLSILLQAFNIIIDHGISEPGHGR